MTEAKTAALPWTMDAGEWPIYIQSDEDRDSEQARMIAVIHCDGDGDTAYKHFPQDEAAAHAEMIIEAVNSHARHVAALQQLAADADALNAQEIREIALEALSPRPPPSPAERALVQRRQTLRGIVERMMRGESAGNLESAMNEIERAAVSVYIEKEQPR